MPDNLMLPTIVAVVNDLMFTVKIMDAAKREGLRVRAMPPGKVLDALDSGPSGVVIDLAFQGADVEGLIRQIKQKSPQVPLLGFLPHVETELRQAATAAGCDRVVARSVFSSRTQELLRELTAPQ